MQLGHCGLQFRGQQELSMEVKTNGRGRPLDNRRWGPDGGLRHHDAVI
jgi:hypothetical protein